MFDSRMNTTPPEFDPTHDLPDGFLEFYQPLHDQFTARQQQLVSLRSERLNRSHNGNPPEHKRLVDSAPANWRISLPAWCSDQRNQMTGPADDRALVVKMLNSGAPGVMLDLEDSMANQWDSLQKGLSNILGALKGSLDYDDPKKGRVAQNSD